MLKTSTLPDAQREAIMKLMIRDFMSSEESGEEMVDGERRAVIKVKPQPWRASRVDRMFKQLDSKGEKRKSKQSKQQTLPRVVGCRSSQPQPIGFPPDFFSFLQG